MKRVTNNAPVLTLQEVAADYIRQQTQKEHQKGWKNADHPLAHYLHRLVMPPTQQQSWEARQRKGPCTPKYTSTINEASQLH